MITRALAALSALFLIAVFTLPAYSVETTIDRRQRVLREATAIARQADEAVKQKEYDKAVELYTRAIDSKAFDAPSNANLLFRRGRAHHAKDDCAAAIADYTLSLELEKSGDVYFMRAACYVKLKQDALALADFDSAVLTNADSGMYLGARCKFLFNKKEYAKALPDCEKALLTQTTDKDLMIATAQAAEQLGNKKRAAEIYAQLLAADPGNTVATQGLKRTGS